MQRFFQLKTFGYEEVDEYIWFPHLYLNALIKIDKRNGKITNLYRFKEYSVRKSYLYSTICKCNNKLILVPNNADKIAVFNLDTTEISYVKIEDNAINRGTPYFRNACVCGNYVYFFPSRASSILKLNVESNDITYLDLSEWIDNQNEVLFRQAFEKANSMVYLPFAEKSYVLILDIQADSILVKELETEDKLGFSTINKVGENFLLSSWKKLEIYKWNEKNNTIKTFSSFPKNIEKEMYSFSYAEVMDDLLFLFPQECNMIVSFNIKNETINRIKEIREREEGKLVTFCGKSYKNSINVFMATEEDIVSLQKKDCEYELKIGVKFDRKYNDNVIQEYMLRERENMFLEPYVDLSWFLKLIAQDHFQAVQEKSNIGKTIYNYLE